MGAALLHKIHRTLPRVTSGDAESYLLLTGIALLALYFGAQLHSAPFSRVAVWEIQEAQAANGFDVEASNPKVDFSLWDRARVKAYRASLALKLQAPIALLSIHRLRLTAPVFDGTDDIILNRGLGRIAGTAAPGSEGNMAIAGHRDGFFRGLKDIQVGDAVEIDTAKEKDTYVVEETVVVDPRDVTVLRSEPVATVTMVTCYPFYFIGDAPQRFIVKASLKQRDFLQQAQDGKPEPK